MHGQVSIPQQRVNPHLKSLFIQFSFEVLPDVKDRVIQSLCDYPWNSDQTVVLSQSVNKR